MLKKKFSYEKSVNIILNDDYKDDIILMHHDEADTEIESITSSKVINTRPRKKLGSSQNVNFSNPSSMRRVENKKNIFDDSMDMEDIRKPSNRALTSRRSIKDINNEMKIKEEKRKAKTKSKLFNFLIQR
jgi:hypothetical protein